MNPMVAVAALLEATSVRTPLSHRVGVVPAPHGVDRWLVLDTSMTPISAPCVSPWPCGS